MARAPLRASASQSQKVIFALILEFLKILPEEHARRNAGEICFNILCKVTKEDKKGWHEHSLRKGKKISFCDKCNKVYSKKEFCFWCH